MVFFLTILLFSTTAYADNTKDLYLDLMKKCLINSIYQDGKTSWDNTHSTAYQQDIRENGLDWPNLAHTMIGLYRLNNLQFCVEYVLQNNIPGDLIETGVWRGGACIFMRAILKAYDNIEKKVFVADSFEGMPIPNPKFYPANSSTEHWIQHNSVLAISLPQVQANFERYDLLDHQVVFLKGWFHDTLPHAPIEKLAVMRLDGDLYESTMDALTNLYPKLSIGGFVIIDDYMIPCCATAVHDFRHKFNITDVIYSIDNVGVFWQRTK
ncbi:macrocin O-methyltransferase [candidate division TM6 bacterium RIFCSPHIGHO2_12_FULL_38_8]|nr:MAG: macrocin O-methyltransferase [candidate division TM6 bacterium RIFCSPHIGHO2_12_FULL_38_8]